MVKNNVHKSPPVAREEALHSITDAWRGIKRHMHVRISERVRSESVTSLSQCAVLSSICTRTDVTIKKVAAFLGITSPAATQLVNELAAQDLLKKMPNPEDSRSTLLRPTPRGKQRLAKTDKIFSEEFEKLLAPLTDKEIVEYKRLSEKIATSLYEKQS